MTQYFSDPLLIADENRTDTSEQDVFVFPVSFAQQRLWFLDQLLPGNSLYNIPAALRLSGVLNVSALSQSLNEIVRRHEALRTTFITENDQPVQAIASALSLTLPLVDLRELAKTEREAQALRLAIGEAQQPFDLTQGPLLRAKVLQLGEQEYVLLFTMHHIISDGWSMGVLIRELAALYEAFTSGKPSPLPELSIQYVDFAIWQQQWLQGEVLEAQLAYWKQQLAGVPAFLALPTDRPRPPAQTLLGATQSFQLPKSLSVALKALSQREGVTLFMTLLAAFKVLLYRYSGQSDILAGSPIANRNRAEIEGLIGFFVNTLVLRTDLSGSPSFQELLTRVRSATLAAYAHQDLPFEKLVEEIQPERDLSYSPLFQVMFILQNAPMPALELLGLSLSPLEFDSATAKFDLTLSIEDTEFGLKGSLEYNTDLFDATTINRMAGHLLSLLEGIVAHPEQQISTLPMLTQTERHQLLVEWNDTQQNYLHNKCIHQLFENQVEHTPDSVAVVFGDEQLTYRELNYRANQLAHYLQALGVGPEVLVGICVERSLALVVGLLGILKAGAAYIPLDPGYPKERLSFILEDSKVPVLLTQQRLAQVLSADTTKLVYLDTDSEVIAQKSKENPVNRVATDNLAYVIYTSGSTGKPKGVAIEHHSTVALVDWARGVFTSEDLAGVLASTSICFDLSVFELFVPLSCGGRVVLAENALHLPTLPDANNVTLINTVPSAIAELLKVNGVPASVRTVNLAGEPLQNKLVQQIYQQDSIDRVFNLYGPSEDTTYSTFALVNKGNRNAPSIGRPIANTQIYLLDAYLQPVPIGVPGELHIGGAGLARGYLNQPELTAQKFVVNPFSQEPRERLYKTGDLARYLSDGNIEFLGRIDHQVKIRGFRIELGEIEAVLSQNPNVQEAIVIVWEEVPDDKRLVAYVIPNQDQPPTVNQLRRFLQEQLPEYMIPSTFVFLDTFPLTPNGKVDRRNLPAPEKVRPELESNFVAPRTPSEEMLSSIWAAVLGLESVGVHDNFFELGGHSLLATQVISRVRHAFQIELPLRKLFESPTLAGLAESIETARQAKQSLQEPPILRVSRNRSILSQQSSSQRQSPLVGIQPVGSKRPFFCVHPAGGNVICYVDLARYLGLDQPLYGLQALGLDGEQEPYTQVKDMAVHYIKALRIVQPEGPYLLGGWSMGGIVAFEMATQLQAEGQKVDLLALFDAKATACNVELAENDGNVAIFSSFAQELGVSLENLNFSLEYFLQLEPNKQLAYVFEKARMSNLLSPDIELPQVSRLFHVFKTNICAMWSYIPQTYSGRVTLFQASEQLVEAPQNSTMGWGKLATQGVEIHAVPGNHYTMLKKPHIESLVKRLNTFLNKAQPAVIH